MEKIEVKNVVGYYLDKDTFLQRTVDGWQDSEGNTATLPDHAHTRKAFEKTAVGDVVLFQKTSGGFDVFRLSKEEAEKVGFK